MIWISTLCLLAVAAWLLFNALNERRWVEAHSHDETVASDTGLFSSLTARTSTGKLDSDGKLSIDNEDTPFARAVTTVKEKSSKYGDKFTNARTAAIDGNQTPESSTDDGMLGKAVSKFGETTGRLGKQFDEKIKAASERASHLKTDGDPDESIVSRVQRKVSTSTDDISKKVASGARIATAGIASGARSASQGIREKTAAAKDSGVFDKVVSKVSTGVNKIEQKIDSRAAAANDGSERQDLFSRVASKVGRKVNEIDDKLVDRANKSKDTVD